MKKIILYITLVFLFLGSASYCASTSNYYGLGRQAYSSGDYKLAQRYFWAILNENPSNLPARYYLAHSLAKQQKYNDAAVEYQRIIQTAPNSETAKYAKESLNKISPFISKQLQTVDTSVDTKPDYLLNALSSPQLMRWEKMPIVVYIPNSQYHDTVKSAFQVWQNGAKGILSFSYTNSRQNAQIEIIFKDRLENTNTQKSYIAGLTKPYFKGNYLLKSEITLLTLNPNTKQPLSKEKVYATALHEIGHAIGIKGHSQNPADVMYASGAGYKKTLSARDYNTVKLLYNVNPNTLKNYSSQIYKTKFEEAIAYVNKYPTKTIGWLNLADLYRNNGQLDKAIEMYNKALTIDRTQAEPYFFLGECYYKKQLYSYALNYYKNALYYDSNNKYYLRAFAVVCKQTNNKPMAQQYLNNYIAKHPNQKNDSIIAEIQNMLK